MPVAAMIEVLEARELLAAYSLERVVDPDTSNLEYRAFLVVDGSPFHFLTMLQTPAGAIAMRPHPDRADPDGFGTTWYVSPFLQPTGETSGPAGGRLKNVAATDSGVDFTVGGTLARNTTTTAGVWANTLHLVYDPAAQRINGSGTLTVILDQSLAGTNADLNVYRIASNYLDDVNVPGVGIVDTGDMKSANVTYGSGSPQDFTWIPPQQPGHYPTDQATSITIAVNGDVNKLDPIYQQDHTRPRKPNLSVKMNSEITGAPLTAGFSYDTSQSQNLVADNVGIATLVNRSTTTQTTLRFTWTVESTPTNVPLAAGGPSAGATTFPDVLVSFYRAFNMSENFHFFTASQPEHQAAVGAGLREEGIPFQGLSEQRLGAVPLFRLYNLSLGYHYYTAGPGELQALVTTGWRYEGVEMFVYPIGQSPPSGTMEVFRLYNTDSGTHLLSTNSGEMAYVLAITNSSTGNHPWQQHSSLAYAFSPSASSPAIVMRAVADGSAEPSEETARGNGSIHRRSKSQLWQRAARW